LDASEEKNQKKSREMAHQRMLDFSDGLPGATVARPVDQIM
jgi:hypothetical protein